MADPSSSGPSWRGADRRTEVRILSANLVNYAEIASQGDVPGPETIYELLGTARTVDLSAGGCRILAREPLPVGAVIDLKLQLGDAVVELRGRVVRLRGSAGEGEEGFEVGVQFVDLDELAQDGIRMYLELKGD